VIRAARSHDAGYQRYQCGLLVNRTPTAYAAVLASLMVGSPYVPLNPQFPRRRLRDVLLSSAVDTIVVDHRSSAVVGPLLDSLPRPLTVLMPDAETAVDYAALPRGHRYIPRGEIEGTSPAAPTADCSAEDGAYLLSGSAGTPKGVLISVARSGLCQQRSRARIALANCSISHLICRCMACSWLGAPARAFTAPERGGVAGLGDFIRRYGLTFFFSVPATATFMRQLRMLKPCSYPTFRWSLFCGEALPMGLAQAWRESAPNSIVENLYGPTEATVAFTAYRLPRRRRSELDELPTVPIGMPLAGQKVMLVDDNGKPMPDGEAGELCLGGSQVAAGYWRARGQSASRFQPPQCADAEGMRWYRTGDRAVMNKEHGLIFLGRIDRRVGCGCCQQIPSIMTTRG
jgi:non-ribosomal peptide synthetase component F